MLYYTHPLSLDINDTISIIHGSILAFSNHQSYMQNVFLLCNSFLNMTLGTAVALHIRTTVGGKAKQTRQVANSTWDLTRKVVVVEGKVDCGSEWRRNIACIRFMKKRDDNFSSNKMMSGPYRVDAMKQLIRRLFQRNHY